jgi:hypothetical protein
MREVQYASAATQDGEPMNILFIGNSFTARNDLRGMVELIAEAAGKDLEHRLISVGGASLRTHWNKGEARRAIETGGYDAVVLQEQSTLPVKNAGRMHENVRLFDEVIRAAGARTVLYMTWARAHAPESQKLITDAYLEIGRELGAAVIPAGNAWARILSREDPPKLHDRDGSHPTLAGTYLAACCAFATLFGHSPVGLWAPVEIPAMQVAMLQRAAWAEAKPK